MKILAWLRSLVTLLIDIQSRIQKVQEALGRIEGRQVHTLIDSDITTSQYRVFSQWGEDGIIQMLLNKINVPKKVFIEFGVQHYTESNTRFLVVNNNWSGLLIDGSIENIEYIKNDPIYWQHNLKAECSFITRENINDIFIRNGMSGEIGLLSIDIDGNDYWVWKEITVINPAIVVVEYNARFGKDKAVTVPYDPGFVRENAHFSHIYYGASLKALCLLGGEKGYAFVGANSAGNNAFFVRRDLMSERIKEISAEDGFVENRFRESRDAQGKLAFLTNEQERELLMQLQLVTIVDGGL